MKSGICPKCGAAEIYMKKGGFQSELSVVLRLGNVKFPSFDDYICTSCGYFERYIANLNDLADIPKTWTKVQG